MFLQSSDYSLDKKANGIFVFDHTLIICNCLFIQAIIGKQVGRERKYQESFPQTLHVGLQIKNHHQATGKWFFRWSDFSRRFLDIATHSTALTFFGRFLLLHISLLEENVFILFFALTIPQLLWRFSCYILILHLVVGKAFPVLWRFLSSTREGSTAVALIILVVYSLMRCGKLQLNIQCRSSFFIMS